MKKIASIILCLALVFSVFPKALFAAARGGSGLSLFGEEPADGGHSLSLGELDQALEELEVRSNEHK